MIEEQRMSGTTSNQRLKDWVAEWAAIMQPADIYWCDGSADEYERLCQQLVDSGTFTKLDEAKRPRPYVHLLSHGNRSWPEQQLARPSRNAR
jgi:phosphoenolpyruvate carboxykinase (GTP)